MPLSFKGTWQQLNDMIVLDKAFRPDKLDNLTIQDSEEDSNRNMDLIAPLLLQFKALKRISISGMIASIDFSPSESQHRPSILHVEIRYYGNHDAVAATLRFLLLTLEDRDGRNNMSLFLDFSGGWIPPLIDLISSGKIYALTIQTCNSDVTSEEVDEHWGALCEAIGTSTALRDLTLTWNKDLFYCPTPLAMFLDAVKLNNHISNLSFQGSDDHVADVATTFIKAIPGMQIKTLDVSQMNVISREDEVELGREIGNIDKEQFFEDMRTHNYDIEKIDIDYFPESTMGKLESLCTLNKGSRKIPREILSGTSFPAGLWPNIFAAINAEVDRAKLSPTSAAITPLLCNTSIYHILSEKNDAIVGPSVQSVRPKHCRDPTSKIQQSNSSKKHCPM
jgi:hypothetical protein